ncbi:unnamed protein product [Owenia fusiformis]|uniref:Uncharacterized protein n=1 Tax=Owenia fusiformis TaxID=6347 RepID=A0A8J1UF42_OWEFU|nr:unnamed protein product [Owenia fusiformis]
MATASNIPSITETLFRAVEHAKIRSVSNLLDSGADVNVHDSNLQTPLMRAVYVPKEDIRRHIIRLLLEHGSDVNSVDERSRTALMLASFEPNREDVVRLLIRTRKCDPNVNDVGGNTALMYAAYGGNASVIRILVHSAQTKHIIKANVMNFNKQTALDISLKLRHNDCVRVLVREANVDTSNTPQDALNEILNQDQYISSQVPMGHIKSSWATLEKISIHSKSSTSIQNHVSDNDTTVAKNDLYSEPNQQKAKKTKSKRSRKKMRQEMDSNINCTAFEDVFAVNTIRDTLTATLSPRGLTSPSRRTHLYGENASNTPNGLPPVNIPFTVSDEKLYPEYTSYRNNRLLTNENINPPQAGSAHLQPLHNAPKYDAALGIEFNTHNAASPEHRKISNRGDTNSMFQGLKRSKQLAPLSPRYTSRYSKHNRDELETDKDDVLLLPAINSKAKNQGASLTVEYSEDDANRAKTV